MYFERGLPDWPEHKIQIEGCSTSTSNKNGGHSTGNSVASYFYKCLSDDTYTTIDPGL